MNMILSYSTTLFINFSPFSSLLVSCLSVSCPIFISIRESKINMYKQTNNETLQKLDENEGLYIYITYVTGKFEF